MQRISIFHALSIDLKKAKIELHKLLITN